MGGFGGTPPGAAAPRGSIDTLRSGSLRVRVCAGTDVLTGRRLDLSEVIPAGPKARQQAERVCADLVRQVEEGRAPRTNASLSQLIRRYLELVELDPNNKATQDGSLRRHIEAQLAGRSLGDLPISRIGPEQLGSFTAELRRCRDHCDGQPFLVHRKKGEHRCTDRCRPHACRPLAPGTIRHIHTLIRASYVSAIRWAWIARNPMDRGQLTGDTTAAAEPADAGAGGAAGERELATRVRPPGLGGHDHRHTPR